LNGSSLDFTGPFFRPGCTPAAQLAAKLPDL